MAMTRSRCANFVDNCFWGLRCSWWHLRQAKDVVAFEQSIFSENQDYKSFRSCNEDGPCRFYAHVVRKPVVRKPGENCKEDGPPT